MKTLFLTSCLLVTSISAFAKSSMSDDNKYPKFCRIAAQNPVIFQNFKRDPFYNTILEHVTFEQGKQYLKIVQKQSPEFLTQLELFRQNDLVGNPRAYKYPGVGFFSPTTLRYMKVASDLKKLFGSLDNLRIIEIGGGYGGQCAILTRLFKVKSYTIVDLQGPLALTARYLQAQGNFSVELLQPEEVTSNDEPYDLVISNYAFSECNREVQTDYLQKILVRSKMGYLTCNYTPMAKKLKSYKKDELVKAVTQSGKSCKVMKEEPYTYDNNYILTWK